MPYPYSEPSFVAAIATIASLADLVLQEMNLCDKASLSSYLRYVLDNFQ